MSNPSLPAALVKIHVGCGQRKIHGWINVDVDHLVKPDRVDTAFLETFTDGSASVIYACHVLEHVPRNAYLSVLSAWFAKLAPGGTARVAVPDFCQVARAYVDKRATLPQLRGFLVGGQKTSHDFHTMAFDFATLKDALVDVGFRNVREYDWWKTEHHFIDDYSQAYLPHMDKINGTCMSLNVEADKPA